LRTLAELKQLGGKQDLAENFITTWMERLAAVAMQADGAPAAALVELFQQRRLPMRLQRITGEVLIEAGRYETAEKILSLAERAYPASRTLVRLRSRVNEALQAQAVPAPKVEPGPAPVKEEEFFARMAELEAEQRWRDAAQEVRAIRVAKPDWLPR